MIFVDPDKKGDATVTWEVLGKDNDELSKELNNEVEETKNVLGESEVDVTAGNRTMTVDPSIKFSTLTFNFFCGIHFQKWIFYIRTIFIIFIDII